MKLLAWETAIICFGFALVTGCAANRQPDTNGGASIGAILGGVAGATASHGNTAGALAGAFAGGLIGRDLDERDRQIRNAVLFHSLQANKNNQSNTWTNPATGNSGSIKPLSEYTKSTTAQVCRDFIETYTRNGQTYMQESHACRGQPETSWEIVDRTGGGGQTQTAGYFTQKVFFATDRLLTGDTDPANTFGVQRSTELRYGEVDVSIPPDHQPGELESPTVWRLEFHADPNVHVMALRTSVMSQADFLAALRTDVHASAKRSAFVFVHGYHVSFADAARRTAQMAYDLRFDGAAIFFSWPSQDQLVAYMADRQRIAEAEPHLEQFLKVLLTQTDADNIYLIAHSIGTWALTKALTSLAASDQAGVKRIKEIILAAPDISAVEFTEQIVPGLISLGAPITLYASSNDRALKASRELQGGDRAGEAGDHLIVLNGIETIDASDTDTDLTDLIKHSYFAERNSVLADMFYLIGKDIRAAERWGLKKKSQNNLPYWVFLSRP